MSSRQSPQAEHPVLGALRAAHAALDGITVAGPGGQHGWVPMADLDPLELAEVVRLHAELEGRVAGLRLHTVAAAEVAGAAEVTAAVDTGAWAATAGRNRSRTWGAVWLANLLESTYAHTRSALAGGRISEEHAAVIVDAAQKVPDTVSAADVSDCEAILVEKAARMTPQNLRRAARRLLEPLSKQAADAHEEELLREQEHHAECETWLTLCDNGDGTWGGRFVIPELHGQLLKARLEQLSSPRRYGRTRTGEAVEDPTVGNGKNQTEAFGAALVELLEHLPDHGHARSGVSVVVHVQEESLRAEVGAATVGTGAETGPKISNQEVRRLLCEASILPLMMGGRSLPLDLGMSSRLFTKNQWVALSAVHDTCAAEGCTRPYAWCELHHKKPWAEGGPTDLANAAPLCGHHHRRVHDDNYEHQWLPDGTVRFRHRWRSRWWGRIDPWAQPNTIAS